MLPSTSRLKLLSHATCKLFNHKPSHIRCVSISATHWRRFGPVVVEDQPPPRKNFKESLLPDDWLKLIEKYPEFLPDPINNSPILVTRTVEEMIQRRTVLDIPEFYVGSILSVTCTNQYSDTKRTKFVGICIHRTGQLKHANFTLRNVIDGMGVEVRYDLYNPLILSIEVLKLEKRLDDTLIYLRDAPPEYSTVPEDMKPITHDASQEVPVNKTLVKLKPFPWSRRWERYLLRGVQDLENVPQLFADRAKPLVEDPSYNFDTMLDYRRNCTEEMMYGICKRLAAHEAAVVKPRIEAKLRKFIRVTKTIKSEDEARRDQEQEKEQTDT